jgi:hypothetical protein
MENLSYSGNETAFTMFLGLLVHGISDIVLSHNNLAANNAAIVV